MDLFYGTKAIIIKRLEAILSLLYYTLKKISLLAYKAYFLFYYSYMNREELLSDVSRLESGFLIEQRHYAPL
jgi:hypothetical protein